MLGRKYTLALSSNEGTIKAISVRADQAPIRRIAGEAIAQAYFAGVAKEIVAADAGATNVRRTAE